MIRREFIETSAGAMGAAMLPLSESPGASSGEPSDRHPGGRGVLRRRGHRPGPRRIPGDGRHQHAVPGHVHLWPRHRRTSAAWQRAAGSRQAGVRRQLSRRKLRDAAPAVLPGTRASPAESARSSRLRRDRGRAAARPTRDEGHLLVRGCVPQDVSGPRSGVRSRRARQAGARVCYRNPNTRTSGWG